MHITLQQKRNIDLIAPTLIAGGAAWLWYKKGGKDWRTLVALVLLCFLGLYIITTKVTKALYLAAPDFVPLGADVSVNPCKEYNPTTLTDSLREDVYRSVFSVAKRDLAAYRALAACSNCELEKVYNDWLARYFKEEQETLPQAVAAEIAFLDPQFTALKDALATRFATLGLN